MSDVHLTAAPPHAHVPTGVWDQFDHPSLTIPVKGLQSQSKDSRRLGQEKSNTGNSIFVSHTASLQHGVHSSALGVSRKMLSFEKSYRIWNMSEVTDLGSEPEQVHYVLLNFILHKICVSLCRLRARTLGAPLHPHTHGR